MASEDFTDGTEEDILDWYFTTGGAPTRPTEWWMGLFTTKPTADAGTGGVEVSETGYTREQITTWVRTSQTMNPDAIVTFGPATEDWTEAVAFGIFSAVTAGTLYAFKTLTTARTVLDGDSAEFAVADLSITLD